AAAPERDDVAHGVLPAAARARHELNCSCSSSVRRRVRPCQPQKRGALVAPNAAHQLPTCCRWITPPENPIRLARRQLYATAVQPSIVSNRSLFSEGAGMALRVVIMVCGALVALALGVELLVPAYRPSLLIESMLSRQIPPQQAFVVSCGL